jgi:penicillin-binding protein 2
MTLTRRHNFFLTAPFCVLLLAPFVTSAANSRTELAAGKPGALVQRTNLRSPSRGSGDSATSQRKLSARELRRRIASENALALKKRRAEAHRLAALARQRAGDEAMRNEVQTMIARDDTRGEDEQVRRVAVTALGNHAGTVVVMDPNTGRVYAIVNQEWALRRGFKPCSTIKLVTGVAGLNEKVIDPIDTARTSGAFHINLTDALAYSNNTYFQQVGGRVGFDKMIGYARQLGLGQKSGINTPDEFAGTVPLFKSGFAVNHMSSHGDDFQVTAVQLVTLVSAMANGGKLLRPYVPHNPQDEAKLKSRVRWQLRVDPEAITNMVPGMIGSVNYGSGKRAYSAQETVAGKTGTCVGEGGWVGLFASYAPVASPRLAVVVIARGSDAHGHFPAAVAGQIYRDLSSRFDTPTNLQIASRNLDTPSLRKDPKAALDEEDTETAVAAGESAPANRELVNATINPTITSQIVVSSAAGSSNKRTPSNVRPVLMTFPTPRLSPKPTAPLVSPDTAPKKAVSRIQASRHRRSQPEANS